MRDWKRTGLVVLLVGLVTLGAFAAQGWFGTRDRVCTDAHAQLCPTAAGGQPCPQTEQACQQFHGNTCPGGMRGTRPMRCGR